MDWKNLARLVLLLVAIAMLCYQSQKAVALILAPPMMITAQQVDISEVPLPMMYICPLNQYNKSKLEENKFASEADIIEGKVRLGGQRSWGSHVNMTFEELIGNVTDIDLDAFIGNIKEETDQQLQIKPILFPKFGYCFDVQNYNIREILELPGKGIGAIPCLALGAPITPPRLIFYFFFKIRGGSFYFCFYAYLRLG